jgi:hypothetical protein
MPGIYGMPADLSIPATRKKKPRPIRPGSGGLFVEVFGFNKNARPWSPQQIKEML